MWSDIDPIWRKSIDINAIGHGPHHDNDVFDIWMMCRIDRFVRLAIWDGKKMSGKVVVTS